MIELERKDFQILLFRTAFCLMACDGHIDDREIKEIKLMNENSSYFQGIDLSDELTDLLKELKNKGKHIVDELFNSLNNLNLTIVQELLVLEVAIRIQNADDKLDENEIKFIQFLRSKLRIHDQIIKDRFGSIEFLFDKEYSQNVTNNDVRTEFLNTAIIPEIFEMKKLNFEKD